MASRQTSTDPLAPDHAQALDRGRRQLQNLLRDGESGRLDPEAQQRLLDEAMRNLAPVLKSTSDRGASAPTAAATKAEERTERSPIDREYLERLLAQLERMQVERLIDVADPAESGKISPIDPRQLPPGYRSWIERYYRKLAEQP